MVLIRLTENIFIHIMGQFHDFTFNNIAVIISAYLVMTFAVLVSVSGFMVYDLVSTTVLYCCHLYMCGVWGTVLF